MNLSKADNQAGGAGLGTVAIARAFVAARHAATPLAGFPGAVPTSLDDAYACQDAAIGLWADDIAGWKVGRIPEALTSVLGADRLIGPIFARTVRIAEGGRPARFPVFSGGFAAVEAEYVVRLAHDAPADRAHWTVDEARDLVGDIHIGIEAAGSPLSTINALGPTVVVSDFGNNAGLIVGPPIPDWRNCPDDALTSAAWVDGKLVGRGGAANLIDGPLGSLCFALEIGARRGRPLRAGMWISTGATTGIHDIIAGQSARLVFDGFGEIVCLGTPATPAGM